MFAQGILGTIVQLSSPTMWLSGGGKERERKDSGNVGRTFNLFHAKGAFMPAGQLQSNNKSLYLLGTSLTIFLKRNIVR